MSTPYLPPEPLPDEDWLADDPALRRFLAARLPPSQWKALEPRLRALGVAAPREVDPLARRADARGPRLRDDGSIAFDAAYEGLRRLAREHEAFTLSWRPLADAPRAPRVATFALGYLYAQAECGYYCPACMTDGAAFVLERHAPADVRDAFVPRLVQREAEGALEGAMFLTERAGGSDVGSTATTARREADGSWRLTGDKWFCSNAGAGAVLTLARMPGTAPEGTRGLGLFLVPAPQPGLRCVRLKEKLGVRSMATGEFELRDARALLVAGEGDGFKRMAEMVNLSRLYNAVASVALARRALREGQKNGSWRRAFGKPLREHPLYARAVAALAVDVRGALLFILDVAERFDRAARGDEDAYRLMRALNPLAKAETARLAVRAASEACEMLGGNGYVEEWVTPRLLRDAQVLPIWEGTTNVQALDFLRACAKERAAEALVEDSLALVPEGSHLADAWRAWAREAEAAGEMQALRLLTRAYHLRCATLLAHDAARDGDADAQGHARAYLAKNVLHDERAFEAQVAREGAALAGWATGAA